MAIPAPLRITFVTTQAAPYILGDAKEEAQFASRVPHALHQMGAANVRLVLPLFKQTEQALANNGFTMERDLHHLRIKAPVTGKDIKAKAHRLTKPYGFPVYFIEQKDYFNRDNMYNESDDLIRFSMYYKLTLALMRSIGEPIDILECAENQGAWGAIHLNEERNAARREFGGFFDRTRSTLRINTFYFKAEVGSLPLGESGYCPPSLLARGINEADMSYARSLAYINERAKSGKEGPFIAEAVAIALEEQRIVGLWENNTALLPDCVITPAIAEDAAKRLLTVYARLADRPIQPVVHNNAVQTSPAIIWPERVWTPREKLSKTNPEAVRHYDQLSQEDKDIVDLEVCEGREARFARVKNKTELDNIISFLKIRPDPAVEKTIDFEKLLRKRADKVAPWDSLFYPGDINRLLWSQIDLSKSKNNKFTGETKVRIINAMFQVGILPHIIRFFESLHRISISQYLPPIELDKILAERGKSDEEETKGLSRNALDFLMLSAIHKQLLSNIPIYQAFIIGIILHDIGKCLGNEDSLEDNHPENGAKMAKDIPALGVLLDEKQRAFALSVIRHHSTISDIIITHEARLSDIEKIYTLFAKDHGLLLYFFQALLVVGVADMDAARSKARLIPSKIIRLWQVVEALLSSSDINILRKKLARLNISPESEGDYFWNDLVVRYFAGEIEEKGLSNPKEKRRLIARNEIIQYCRRQDKHPAPSGQSKHKKLKRRYKLSETVFKKQLGSINILGINDILLNISDTQFRAKFVIAMVAIANRSGRKSFRLKISPNSLELLLSVLSSTSQPENLTDEFNFNEIDEAGVTNIRFDPRKRAK